MIDAQRGSEEQSKEPCAEKFIPIEEDDGFTPLCRPGSQTPMVEVDFEKGDFIGFAQDHSLSGLPARD